jgi:hypothetical protein
VTGASLPGFSLDQRVPQACALLLAEANTPRVTRRTVDTSRRCIVFNFYEI